MSLTTYRKKRNFARTAEPQSRKRSGDSGPDTSRFVIQKHDASRLHYDLRLEMGGRFKSWAVPKGMPAIKGEKRLAVHVEDHPLEYGTFEGTIPKGEYGGGTVMLWDRGTFTPLSRTPAKELSAGKLHFILEGEKLRGEWYLVRLRDGKQWLVIKGGKDMKPLSKKRDDTSVLSGLSMRQLSTGTPPAESKRAAVTAPVLPHFVKPMAAKLITAPPPGEWIYEIKFDGWRALALKGGSGVKLLSRNEKELGARFPEIMEAVAALKVEDAVLDGEIVAIDGTGRSSFQLLQKYDTGQERPPIVFYVFDLLRLNGRNLTTLSLTDRKAALQKLLKNKKSLIRYSASMGSDGKALLGKARDLGLEGLIGKKPESPYEPGARSGAWIKLKLHQEQEFVIGGYTDPEGSRHSFGALLAGYYSAKKLRFAGKVGTGFDHAMLRTLHKRFQSVTAEKCPFTDLPDQREGKWGQGVTAAAMKKCHWLKPQLVCQVKFSEWTRDGRLRHPVFLGLREDKKSADVVREIPS